MNLKSNNLNNRVYPTVMYIILAPQCRCFNQCNFLNSTDLKLKKILKELLNRCLIVAIYFPTYSYLPTYTPQVSSVGQLIPYTLVLHLLFARSPPQLKSPHQVTRTLGKLEIYSVFVYCRFHRVRPITK